MVGDGTLLHGDMALEVGLDFVRGLPGGQAKAVGYAEHVGVHGYYGLADQFPGHVYEVAGLAVGVGYGAYQRQHVLEGGGGKCLRVRVPFEEGGSDHVHPLVGALGREDDRDYQLVSVPEVQLGLHGGAVGGEPVQNGRVSPVYGKCAGHLLRKF